MKCLHLKYAEFLVALLVLIKFNMNSTIFQQFNTLERYKIISRDGAKDRPLPSTGWISHVSIFLCFFCFFLYSWLGRWNGIGRNCWNGHSDRLTLAQLNIKNGMNVVPMLTRQKWARPGRNIYKKKSCLGWWRKKFVFKIK